MAQNPNVFLQNTIDILEEAVEHYQSVFVDKEYLLYSNDCENKYFIITGIRENFYHLTGVHTSLYSRKFYKKLLDKELTTVDISSIRYNQVTNKNEDLTRAIRSKRQVINNIETFFESNLFIEENFNMGDDSKVSCKLASSDNICTIGFAEQKRGQYHPQTLLNGNKLSSRKISVDLVLSKLKNTSKFDNIVQGNVENIRNIDTIRELIDQNLIS